MLKSDFGLWIGAVLVALIISYAINFLGAIVVALTAPGANTFQTGGFSPGLPLLSAILMLASYVVSGALGLTMTTGISWIGVQRLRGLSGAFSDIFTVGGAFKQVFGFYCLVHLVVYLPFLALPFASPNALGPVVIGWFGLLLVAMIAYPRWMLVPLVLIDQRVSIGQALSTSAQALKGQYLITFWVMFCASFLSGLGFIACFVGVLFTAGLVYLTPAVIYHDFFRRSAPVPLGSMGDFSTPPPPGG